MSDKRISQAIELFNDGQSIRQIASTLHMGRRQLARELKAAGFTVLTTKEKAEAPSIVAKTLTDPENTIKGIRGKRYVITCALNNCEIDKDFLASIQVYCKKNKAQLLVVPVHYKNVSLFSGAYEPWWPSELDGHWATSDLLLNDNLVLMGSMRIQATAVNPLSGTAGISCGRSAIYGHPQGAMGTVPTPMNKLPLVQLTTLSLSKASYSETKSGRLGEFAHSVGALIVEVDGEKFWWRHVHAGENGAFIDLDSKYTADGVEKAPPALAVAAGDVHVGFDDKEVVESVFGNRGLVQTVGAKNVILHDLLDFFSGSHHHERNRVLKVLKEARGRNSVYSELFSVAEWLSKYTKEGQTAWVIRSNHSHDHLDKWLNLNSEQVDTKNQWLWHTLNSRHLQEALELAERDPSGEVEGWHVTSAFELAMREFLSEDVLTRVRFPDDRNPLEFAEIDCSNHGDKGPNGSRGGGQAYRRVQRKTIVGHSHSPMWTGGCMVVGMCARSDLPYMSGYSGHLHCMAVIYSDGSRTLIPVIAGKFRG